MRALLLCVAVATTLAITAATVRAASFPAGCGLPGLVRVGGRACPPRSRRPRTSTSPRVTVGPRPTVGMTGTGGTEHSDLFGISIGGIFGSLAGKVLGTIVGWVADGAAAALRFTAHLISETTRPDLGSSWFSASYWRVGGLAALLTVPFLCAAAVHALVRSDLALLARAAFGYLPLAMIAVAIAAPLTTLVLSATDEMSAFVAGASGHADATFLAQAATAVSATSAIAQDPFLAFFAGIVTVLATMSLWVELVIRAAAVEVIVLMLPLFFAAMVWPARRVWAIRAIETLFALILSKFVIVSVLSLGGSAIAHASSDGPVSLITGATLVLLAVFSPWALLRILPVHEIAAAAAGGLSAGPRMAVREGRQMLMGGAPAGQGGSDAAGAAGADSVNGGIGEIDNDLTTRLARRQTADGSADGAGDGPVLSPLTTAGLAAVEGRSPAASGSGPVRSATVDELAPGGAGGTDGDGQANVASAGLESLGPLAASASPGGRRAPISLAELPGAGAGGSASGAGAGGTGSASGAGAGGTGSASVAGAHAGQPGEQSYEDDDPDEWPYEAATSDERGPLTGPLASKRWRTAVFGASESWDDLAEDEPLEADEARAPTAEEPFELHREPLKAVEEPGDEHR